MNKLAKIKLKEYAFVYSFFAFSIFYLSSFLINTTISNNTSNKPLPNAHAHNDYQHTQPLLDALSYGFTSIEADVYLIKRELYVSHLPPLFKNKNRTLTKLYLEPLFKRYKENGNQIYPDYNQPIYLMIDIKNKSEATYELLKKQLEPYQEMLSSWENNEPTLKAVNIILSGSRPIKNVLADSKRWVQIDGRLGDLGKNYHPQFMPIISGPYKDVANASFFNRKLDQPKLDHIKKYATQAATEGKSLRLWKTKQDQVTWNALLENGVDFLNTDNLKSLSNFLNNRSSPKGLNQ